MLQLGLYFHGIEPLVSVPAWLFVGLTAEVGI